MIEAPRKDSYTTRTIAIDQQGYEAWVEVREMRQTYGERLTLVSAEWTHYIRPIEGVDKGRRLRGPKGVAYWMPPTESEVWGRRPGHVYARHESGFNSYSTDFESGEQEFTIDDLLNLASAQWDAQYWPHDIDATATNPFTPFELGA